MAVAGIYARKSTSDERSAEDGKSVARQREHAVEFAEKHGWRVDPDLIFTDEATSGAEFIRRPGLARLLAALEAKSFETLIVMAQCRLGRQTVRTLGLIQSIQDAGVTIYGYLDGREITVDGEMGEVESFMKSWADSKMRRDARARVRDAFIRKARLGHAVAGRTYGYRFVRKGEHSERAIVPAEAAVVRRIFEAAVSGLGLLRIARRLTEAGVRAPGKKVEWGKDTIRWALSNELYRGQITYGRTRAVDVGGRASKRERVDPEQWIRVDAPHLRIVSDDLWDRAHRRLEQTRQAYIRTSTGQLVAKPETALASRWLLSGIGRCGECGASLLLVVNHGRPRYYCGEHRRRPGACSNGAGIPMADLDESVRLSLFDLLAKNPEAVAALVEERDARLRAEQATQGDRRAEALIEVAQLEKEIANLITVAASGTASPDIVQAITERRQKVEALKAIPALPPPFDKAAFFRRFEGVRKIAMLLEPSWPAQVRQVIRRLGVERVVVSSDGEGWKFEGLADLSGCVLPSDQARPA